MSFCCSVDYRIEWRCYWSEHQICSYTVSFLQWIWVCRRIIRSAAWRTLVLQSVCLSVSLSVSCVVSCWRRFSTTPPPLHSGYNWLRYGVVDKDKVVDWMRRLSKLLSVTVADRCQCACARTWLTCQSFILYV